MGKNVTRYIMAQSTSFIPMESQRVATPLAGIVVCLLIISYVRESSKHCHHKNVTGKRDIIQTLAIIAIVVQGAMLLGMFLTYVNVNGTATVVEQVQQKRLLSGAFDA